MLLSKNKAGDVHVDAHVDHVHVDHVHVDDDIDNHVHIVMQNEAGDVEVDVDVDVDADFDVVIA